MQVLPVPANRERIPDPMFPLGLASAAFHGLGLDVAQLFGNAGADYMELCDAVLRRRDDVLDQIAA